MLNLAGKAFQKANFRDEKKRKKMKSNLFLKDKNKSWLPTSTVLLLQKYNFMFVEISKILIFEIWTFANGSLIVVIQSLNF